MGVALAGVTLIWADKERFWPTLPEKTENSMSSSGARVALREE